MFWFLTFSSCSRKQACCNCRLESVSCKCSCFNCNNQMSTWCNHFHRDKHHTFKTQQTTNTVHCWFYPTTPVEGFKEIKPYTMQPLNSDLFFLTIISVRIKGHNQIFFSTRSLIRIVNQMLQIFLITLPLEPHRLNISGEAKSDKV